MQLNREQAGNIDRLLNDLIFTKAPFLQHGYTLKQMADDLGVPLHHLSAFINQQYGMHFNDFINMHRVNYCISKMVDQEWRYKKLGVIGDEAGFGNRSTFITAFKKVTGQNPSSYVRSFTDGL